MKSGAFNTGVNTTVEPALPYHDANLREVRREQVQVQV